MPDRFPVVFWDLFGEQGHRVRATISEMGPLLLSRLLDLNDTQEGVLNIAFRIADEQGLLLIDLKDLRALLQLVAENAQELTTTYGNVSKATVGTIQRQLLVLENQRAKQFFGEPALDIKDLMRTDRDGRGIVNILAADKLMSNPRLYATFLLWLMSELFEELPEVGDLDKPKLVFFFDEAHLLFNDAPKALLETVEQVVRLIRSKGVGVYFVTQNPVDVPETVLAQLGNRVQHALRAYTPRDQKAVRVAAETFRQNPAFDTEKAITELGVGEALVSTLEGKGSPSMVERTLIAPPMAQVGPITEAERQADHRREPACGANTSRRSIRIRPTKCWRNGPRRQPRTAQAAQGGGGILDILGGLLGTTGARKGSMTVTQRVTREVTRTVVNQTVGSPRGRRSANRSAAARAAPSAAPSCAARWAGCCGGRRICLPLAARVRAGVDRPGSVGSGSAARFELVPWRFDRSPPTLGPSPQAGGKSVARARNRLRPRSS